MIEINSEVKKIVVQIKEMIEKEFPSTTLKVYTRKWDHYIYFSLKDREVYHSDKYLSFVMKINLEILWPNKIFNILFVCE